MYTMNVHACVRAHTHTHTRAHAHTQLKGTEIPVYPKMCFQEQSSFVPVSWSVALFDAHAPGLNPVLQMCTYKFKVQDFVYALCVWSLTACSQAHVEVFFFLDFII